MLAWEIQNRSPSQVVHFFRDTFTKHTIASYFGCLNSDSAWNILFWVLTKYSWSYETYGTSIVWNSIILLTCEMKQIIEITVFRKHHCSLLILRNDSLTMQVVVKTNKNLTKMFWDAEALLGIFNCNSGWYNSDLTLREISFHYDLMELQNVVLVTQL